MFGNLLLSEATSTLSAFEGDPAAGPDYQPYIFWAYALVCVLLCGFTVWTTWQVGGLTKKVEYLRERFRDGTGQTT